MNEAFHDWARHIGQEALGGIEINFRNYLDNGSFNRQNSFRLYARFVLLYKNYW